MDTNDMKIDSIQFRDGWPSVRKDEEEKKKKEYKTKFECTHKIFALTIWFLVDKFLF